MPEINSLNNKFTINQVSSLDYTSFWNNNRLNAIKISYSWQKSSSWFRSKFTCNLVVNNAVVCFEDNWSIFITSNFYCFLMILKGFCRTVFGIDNKSVSGWPKFVVQTHFLFTYFNSGLWRKILFLQSFIINYLITKGCFNDSEKEKAFKKRNKRR